MTGLQWERLKSLKGWVKRPHRVLILPAKWELAVEVEEVGRYQPLARVGGGGTAKAVSCFVVEQGALRRQRSSRGLSLRLGSNSGLGFLSFSQEVQQHFPFFPFLTQKSIIEPEAIFCILMTKFCTFISSVLKHVS